MFVVAYNQYNSGTGLLENYEVVSSRNCRLFYKHYDFRRQVRPRNDLTVHKEGSIFYGHTQWPVFRKKKKNEWRD